MKKNYIEIGGLGIKAALSLSVALSAMMIGPVASAQTQEPDSEDDARLPTITVSGTKREKTLQDTPVAISVVSSEDIQRAEIQDLNDLQSLVPSLVVRQTQSSANTSFFIRGFGNGANAVGLEPSVGIFIDGVFRSRAASFIPDLPNLERVEVLRGPQSTLFGKNASAGVVSVVTREPQFETLGNIEASIGNFESFRLKGDITGPISESLAYSLSGSLNQRDGFAENLETGDGLNDRDRWGVRGELLFAPNDKLNVRFIADYDEIDEICCVFSNLVSAEPSPQDPFVPTNVITSLGGSIVIEDPFSYEVFVDVPPTNEVENSGFSIQTDYDFGFATLTSILANRSSDSFSNIDSDITNLSIFGGSTSDIQIETFTKEVRLTSNPSDSRFDWMVGAYYFDESIDTDASFSYGSDYRNYVSGLIGNPALIPTLEAVSGAPMGAFAAPGQGVFETSSQENTAWSLFGTVDFHLTDRLTATVGLNYTEDEKDVSMSVVTTDVLAALNLDQLGYNSVLANLLAAQGVNIQNPASVGPFVQGNPALYAQLQQQALAVAQSDNNPFGAVSVLQVFPPFLNFPNAVENGQTRDDDTTYTLRLDYDVSDNVNVYASYATGFKASSWNLSQQSRPFASDFTPGNPIVDPILMQPVFATPSSAITDAGLFTSNLTTGTRFAGPEEAEVYEIGVKAQFDTVAFNVALFDQTIEGFQANIFTETEGFIFQNAEQQSTTGLEFDATWSPIRPLTLTLAATLLDAKYDSFVGGTVDSAGNPIDLSGRTPAGIAETQFSLSGNYNFRVGEMGGFVRADWQHIGDSDFSDNPEDEAILDAAGYSREQNLINASVGVMTKNDILITLWARNLFEDEYLVSAVNAPLQGGNYAGFPGQPRTYGLTVKKSF